MENRYLKLLDRLSIAIENEKIIYGVFSNPRNKEKARKIKLEPVLIKGEYKLQFSYEYSDKVYHKNLSKSEAIHLVADLVKYFRQINLFNIDQDLEILISKKGKFRVIEKAPSKEEVNLKHNRQKNYILEEGVKHDFLIYLGIMDKSGKVLPSRYDKFKQINRFLELVEDIIPEININKRLNIIDFGCGKSYLSFALYYYLKEILKLDIKITGLDLKEDVIDFCNEISNSLNYKELTFEKGDIRDYTSYERVDLVVSLHACDIATDAALVKAIQWNSRAILSVPCCQSEFYSKLDNKKLEPMLKHGIIKERLSALVTDSLRSLVLEILGYKVQLVEFIDIENTPKNILIRAVKENNDIDIDKIDQYKEFKKTWGLDELFIEGELKKINKDICKL